MVLVVAGFVAACVDQNDLLGPPGSVRLNLAPEFVQLGATRSDPITRIRMMARLDGSEEVVGSFDEPVDPDAPFWTLDLPVAIGEDPVAIGITIEMMNAAGVVEWSGRAGPIEVAAGTVPESLPVPVFRGPLDNLDVTAVVIGNADTALIEGDSLGLSATVEGGGTAAVVYWSTSDETRATVGPTGVVRALLPDSVLVFAVAGPHADTLRLGITRRLAGVAIGADTVRFGSLNQTIEIAGRVVDPRGDSIPGRGVTWSVADTMIVRHLGGDQFQALSGGITRAVATSVDSVQFSDTVVLVVQQLPASVQVTPPVDTVAVGGSTTFGAVARDALGNPVAGAAFTWASSSNAVATVGATGVATGVSAGSVSITATSGGVIGNATLVVSPSGPGGTSCSDSTVSNHSGVLLSSQVWTRAGSPHAIASPMTVDSGAVLTIEPGAVVCGAVGAYLYFINGARLDARGTAADPILFSALDTALFWSGIYFDGLPADSSYVTHATLEYGASGVGLLYGYYGHPVVLEDLVVRHSTYSGIHLYGSRSAMRRIDVSDTRTAGSYAVIVGGDSTIVEDLTITDAAGTGLYAYGSGLTLNRIRITDAGEDGLYLTGGGQSIDGLRIENAGRAGFTSSSSGDHLSAASGVRVVGSGSYGFRSGVGDLGLIAPTPAAQDSLLGNGRDTLVVTGGHSRGANLTVRADVPWLIEGTLYIDSTSTLLVQPGAHLRAGPYAQIYAYNGGRIDARGTAALPITWAPVDSLSPGYGIYMYSSAPDTSYLSHFVLSHSYGNLVHADGEHTVLMDSVRIRQATYHAVVLNSPRSRISGSVIDTTLSPAYAAVQLGTGTTFEGTVVRGAAGVGVYVVGNDTRILGGRIENSGGVGLSYASGYSSGSGAPVRITGSGSFPLRVSVSALARIYPTVASQDSLLGNAVDSIAIAGGVAIGDTLNVRVDLPWLLESTAYFDSTSVLNVPAGASIAAEANTWLQFRYGGTLQAIGTAGNPARFTARDPAAWWYGLYFADSPSDTSRLVHALIENAGEGGYAGAYAVNSHRVLVDSTRVRNSRYRAVYLGSAGSMLRGSIIDTTAVAGYPAVELGSGTRIEGSTIRGAAGTGLQLSGTGIDVVGGRIEGAAGVGMYAGSGQSVAAGSISPRITGGSTHPVQIGIQPFGVLFPDVASQDSLLGNASDTIAITGGTMTRDTTYARADLPWRLEGTTYFDSTSVLNALPGASVIALTSTWIQFRSGSTLQAIGTAAQPVRFGALTPGAWWYGLYFADSPSDTSRLVHAVIDNAGEGGYAGVYAVGAHRVRVDSTRVRASRYRGLYIVPSGSIVRGTAVDTTAVAGYPAVELAGDVALDGLTVRGAAGIGLLYGGQPTTPLRVNIVGGATFAAEMTPRAVWRLGEIEDDTIAGNALDRIRVTGGTVVGGTHYLRASLPWQLAGSVTLDSAATLIADPGATVYAEGGLLQFQTGAYLHSLGTAAQPVRFTSSDGTNRWSGLRFYDTPADTSVLLHTRVEYVQDGNTGAVYAAASHPVHIDSSTIVRSTYRGLSLAAPGSRVRATVIDTTVSAGYVAAYFGGDVAVDGLTVRAAASQGFSYPGVPASPLRLNVIDAGGLAGDAGVVAAARLAQIDDDTITGNGADRVVMTGGTLTGLDLVMRPSWQLGMNTTVTIGTGARLIAQPGSELYADGGLLQFSLGGYMEALGTAAAPVVFGTTSGTNIWSGLRFHDAGADTSVLRHVVVANAQDGNTGAVYGDASHVIVLDSSTIRQSTYRALSLNASGSLVRGTVVDTTLQPGYVAAYFNNDIRLEGLTVRAAAGQGFDYAGAASTPIRINVLGAAGVAGEATVTTMARIAQVADDTITGNGANRIRMTGTLTGLDLIMRPAYQLGLNGGVTIGAGARMIGQPGASLYADNGSITFSGGAYMEALGTQAQPIVFSSIDGTNRWSGLRFNGVGADTSVLRHVRVEYAQDGNTGAVYADASHVIVIDSSAIVRSTYMGLNLNASGSLVRATVVDTTLQTAYIAAMFANDVALQGLTVRAAANQGFQHDGAPTTPLRVNVYNAGGLAGQGTPTAVARLTEIADDTVSGSLLNVVAMSGGTLTGLTLNMRPDVTLGMRGPVTIGSGAMVRAYPGSAMRAHNNALTFNGGAYMEALGTAAQPILFTTVSGTNSWNGLRFTGVGTDTTVMRHVRVEYAQDGSFGAISGDASHTMLLDTVVVERSTYVGIRAGAGSILRYITVDTTLTANYRGIELLGPATLQNVRVRASAGDGIQTNVGGVSVTNCELIDNTRHGFNNNNGTPPATISVTFCNLVNNGQNGANNTSTAGSIDATNNWWGDIAGPTGPGGDGVGANVTYIPVANAAYTLTFPQ